MNYKVVSFVLVACCLVGCKSDAEKQSTKAYLDGDWRQVVESGKKWVLEDSSNPVPHSLLNIAYTVLEKHRENKIEISLAYGSTDRVARVRKWASALVEANSENPRAYLLKGVAAENDGDNQAAVVAYGKAITVDSSFKQGYQSLGNLCLANNLPDKALVIYLALLEKFPDYGPVYGNIAMVYIIKNDIPKAIVFLEKSVALEPDDVTGLYNLSGAYLETGSMDKAVDILKKVIELDPQGEVGDDARRRLAQISK